MNGGCRYHFAPFALVHVAPRCLLVIEAEWDRVDRRLAR